MQQVGDQADHPLGLILYDADEARRKFLILKRAVFERFRVALDGRQRCAKLM
ncbi:hypothetical protein D3C81_837690 [compost metagenome]